MGKGGIKMEVLKDDLIESVYTLLMSINQDILQITRKSKIMEKGTADFVTDTDLRLEHMLITELKAIEDIPCLSEESNPNINVDSYWVIDPIDGTTNFIHGYPSYCISIAKVKNNTVEYGFVYNIPHKELYFGKRENGSFLMDVKTKTLTQLSVSSTAFISDSLIGFGCPYDKTKLNKLFFISEKVLSSCHDLKRNGPASLDICYVASGRLDAYYEFDLKEWDYMASKLILEEAGGKITNWNNEFQLHGVNNIVASNGSLHDELLNLLK